MRALREREKKMYASKFKCLTKFIKDLNVTSLCALRVLPQNPNVWGVKGHLYFLSGNHAEAKECYERTVSFVVDASEMHFIFLRLGHIYLEEKEVREREGPSLWSRTWQWLQRK